MDIPPSGMVDHSGPNLYKPLYNGVYGWLNALAPERGIPNHVEQVIGKASYEQPGLIGRKPMATRLVPSECVLPLFYPVFNLGTPIVNRNYLVCFNIRVGHNEADTREEFTRVPFDFTYNPSRFIPSLRLVMKLDHPNLYPAPWGATDGRLQVRQDVPLQAIVAGKPNEVSDPLLFAKLVQVWTGKGCIPSEPKLLKPRPVAVNQRRDKVENPISRMGVSGSKSCAQEISVASEAKQWMVAELLEVTVEGCALLLSVNGVFGGIDIYDEPPFVSAPKEGFGGSAEHIFEGL